jgi:mRNA interferase HigB
MRVISRSRLRQYWTLLDGRGAEGPLRAWYTHVSSKKVSWLNWGDVKRDFATASIVGNCIIFNIGGNKCRLVTRLLFPSQKVFILKVMTHAEYDENKWQPECGCVQAPPKARSKRHAESRGRKGKDGA